MIKQIEFSFLNKLDNKTIMVVLTLILLALFIGYLIGYFKAVDDLKFYLVNNLDALCKLGDLNWKNAI